MMDLSKATVNICGKSMHTKSLAYRIRKSDVFAWDRNSYLTHVISPQKETFQVNLVCIGCTGRHATLPLG